jgi:hypothetical protein
MEEEGMKRIVLRREAYNQLVQVIFVGQFDLLGKLEVDALASIDQRILELAQEEAHFIGASKIKKFRDAGAYFEILFGNILKCRLTINPRLRHDDSDCQTNKRRGEALFHANWILVRCPKSALDEPAENRGIYTELEMLVGSE